MSNSGGPQVGEDRKDAAVVIIGCSQVELGEDVGDVLLDRSERDDEFARDRRIGSSLRDQLERLAFARGERVDRGAPLP